MASGDPSVAPSGASAVGSSAAPFTGRTRTTTLRLRAGSASSAGDGVAGGALARRRHAAARVAERTELGPRGVGRLLDDGADVLAARFGACFGAAVALWFPALLLRNAALRAGQEEVALAGQLGVYGLVDMLALLVIGVVVHAHATGRRVSGRALARRAAARLPGMLVLAVGVGALTTLGTCLCVLPGYAVRWLAAAIPVVYVVEDVGLAGAVARGVRLVTSRGALARWLGWYALADLELLGIEAAPMTFAFHWVADLLQVPAAHAEIEELLGLGGLGFDALAALVAALLLGLATAYVGVVRTLYVVDLRVRAEGLDLEARLAARAEGAA